MAGGALQSPAAGERGLQPGPRLGSARGTGGDGSERPSTEASSAQGRETPPATRSASTTDEETDS